MNPLDNVLYFNNDIDVRLASKNGHQTLICFYLAYLNDSSNIYVANDFNFDGSFFDLTHRLNQYNRSGVRVLREGSFVDFPFRKNSYRIAIKRDPVDRFLSAFNHLKVIQKDDRIRKNTWGELQNKYYNSIDDIISCLEDNILFDAHFLSQTVWLGSSKDYSKLYYSKDIQQLLLFLHSKVRSKVPIEDINNIKINVSRYEKTTLTYNQKSRIMKLYEDDYENGWY